MHAIDVVAMLALLQFLIFGMLVGRARGKYGVHAPATSGSEPFERVFRVQMNTLELLVAFIPALYVASQYWPQAYLAGLGVVYLLGRTLFAYAYIKNPQQRSLGFVLSFFPVLALVLAALVPALLGKGKI